MVAGWMLYGVLVSSLLLVAGLLLEEAGKRLHLTLRGVWVGAMAGSILVPLGSLLESPAGSASPAPDRVAGGSALLLEPLQLVVPAQSPLLSLVEPALLAGWGIVSVCLIAAGTLSLLRLRRAMGGWHATRSRAPRVLLADDAGPAVVGALPGTIVLPRWASPGDRRLMLTHEAEHLRAGDPALLLAAHLLVALLPWNLPLWWQLRRLRLTVEVDCDARVLRRRRDLHSYATLLLDVGERRSGLQPVLVPFAEPASFLERRIRIMLSDHRRKGWMTSVAMTAVAGLLLLVACSTDAPTPGPTEESVSAAPDEGPVDVYPTPAEPEVPTVTVNVPPAADVAPVTPPSRGARSSAATVEDERFAYEASVLHRQPELRNATDVQQIMQRLYPRMLQDANIGGRVVLEFVIEADGTVDRSSIKVVEATHAQFTEVSTDVVERFQFRPGVYNNRNVRVLVRMPITWQPPR